MENSVNGEGVNIFEHVHPLSLVRLELGQFSSATFSAVLFFSLHLKEMVSFNKTNHISD